MALKSTRLEMWYKGSLALVLLLLKSSKFSFPFIMEYLKHIEKDENSKHLYIHYPDLTNF